MRSIVTIFCLVGGIALAQAPGTFTPVAAGGPGGFGTTATLLWDGRVLLVNGANTALYDPKTGAITATMGLYSDAGIGSKRDFAA